MAEMMDTTAAQEEFGAIHARLDLMARHVAELHQQLARAEEWISHHEMAVPHNPDQGG